MTTCHTFTRWNAHTARCEIVCQFSDHRQIVAQLPSDFDNQGKPWTPDKMAVQLRDFADEVADAARFDLT